jgi:hypothetical protein
MDQTVAQLVPAQPSRLAALERDEIREIPAPTDAVPAVLTDLPVACRLLLQPTPA